MVRADTLLHQRPLGMHVKLKEVKLAENLIEDERDSQVALHLGLDFAQLSFRY